MRTSEREAVAWSYVPVAASSLLWIPILLTLGTRAFGDDAQPLVAKAILYFVILLVPLLILTAIG